MNIVYIHAFIYYDLHAAMQRYLLVKVR